MIEHQVSVLTTADIFLIMAALCGVYILVTLLLPVRTYPPTDLAKKGVKLSPTFQEYEALFVWFDGENNVALLVFRTQTYGE